MTSHAQLSMIKRQSAVIHHVAGLESWNIAEDIGNIVLLAYKLQKPKFQPIAWST